MVQTSAYIVTGTTRGIGQALADEIVRRGHLLFSISRAPEHHEAGRHNYMCDLRNAGRIQQVMTRLMQEIPYGACREVILVNNAGMLSPIGFLGKHAPSQMGDPMHVNLMAPILMMSLFIRESDNCIAQRRIINITSGAAWHPYAGWSLYCAAKAGLNMITRCAAIEQHERHNGVIISAVAPGVVETDMQGTIRAAGESEFPLRSRFIKMHEEGRLSAPAQVAELILDLDAAGQFQSGGIYDLRDAVRHDGLPTIAARIHD